MTTQTLDRTVPMSHRQKRRTGAFWLLASIATVFLAGSIAPTPLYAVYQGEWHFSPITTTVVFGVYAVAVLVSLLTVGSISDHIGRKPVLLVAIAVQAVTMWVYATADGVPQLLVARIIQGLSTGAALGAVGAGLLDLDKAKGALANAASAMGGTALGGLLSGVFVQYLPEPTHLIYFVLFGVMVAQGVGVALTADTVTRRPGALSSLKVDLRLPAAVRGPMLAAGPVVLAIWSLMGFYGSLGPTLARHVVHSDSLVLGGVTIFSIAGSAAATVLILRKQAPDRMMRIGIGALVVGVAATLLGVAAGSAVAFFAGTVVAGVGFGAGMQGAIRTVVPVAEAHERAGVLSLLYVVSYVGMGVPAVLAGYLVVHGGGLNATAEEYGVAVILLAVAAVLVLITRGRATRAEDRA